MDGLRTRSKDPAARGLKPASELAANRDHGDRLRYVAGCRCDACRKANAAYERRRIKARLSGDWNGLVPADRARQHLLQLSKRGVGRRAVSAASDVSQSLLCELRKGVRTQIRARTERRILDVNIDCRSDHALMPAGSTHALVRDLLEEGYTEAFIAKRYGVETPHLQLGKRRVTVRTAAKIQRLHRELTE